MEPDLDPQWFAKPIDIAYSTTLTTSSSYWSLALFGIGLGIVVFLVGTLPSSVLERMSELGI